MSTKPALPNLKTLPYGGASSVISPLTAMVVKQYIQENSLAFSSENIQQRFLTRYQEWIKESQLNKLTGLDAFPVAAQSSGTTEGFDKFYLDNATKRFRCFKGEYFYHQAAWRNYFNWSFIEDGPIQENDAIVISMPFSDSGEEHPSTKEVLDEAAKLGVPVLIDCAFFGICQDIEFNFDHPAIHTITFSLSKTYPVAHLRIGMRLTRQDDDDALLVLTKTKYTNRLSAGVGLDILNTITPDWNVSMYAETQKKLCSQLGIEPSKTVIFGVDRNDKYPEYNRGMKSNRLCLSKYLEVGTLPDD